MNTEFPVLTSFGTVLLFAQALEARAAALATAGDLQKAARLHDKRVKRLELLRKERLNEVVLQPVAGLDRAEYLPPEGAVGAAGLASLEAIITRFYRDALVRAVDVLGGLERTFERFARESEELAASLRS
ncbi:MAG: hypothetical protein ABIK09_18950 [Pseudomonadota bacterium]